VWSRLRVLRRDPFLKPPPPPPPAGGGANQTAQRLP